MTSRILVHFNLIDNPAKKPVRLYLRDGIVMNPKVEEHIKASNDFHIVGLKRAGSPYRSLLLGPEEGQS
jgi:hypothetical protein